MGREIERKFLVLGNESMRDCNYRKLAAGVLYRQGYLNMDLERTVRVRVIGDRGFLTVKGRTVGATRAEYEYEIPANDAGEMLANLCEKPLIEKIRYRIEAGPLVWEVDEFFGDNTGLVVAEVELDREDQPIVKPAWIGGEVTDDPRYYNANLAKNPYKNWKV